ncbi:hypothetical protein Tco_1149706, partial [Tanacetum coccineum]
MHGWYKGYLYKLLLVHVMAISVISVSSDSSEESVGTSTGRVILFRTIPTTILDTTPSVISPSTHIDIALTPTSPNYTPASPGYSPASDTESDPTEDPSSDHIPPLPFILPFLSSTDDSSDNDTPYTPPSPTHVDYSSLYHFALDDSSRDSSSSSSSETSSDPSSDDLSDSSSDHSLPAPSSGIRPSHHLCSLVPSIPHSSAAISDRPSHDYSSASPSHKRSRSLVASVPLSSPIPGTLSSARADLLPSPKRIRSPESATDLEVSSMKGSEPSRYRGTDLKMDDDVERSDGIDIDPDIQVEIDEFIAYADALRVRGIDARVVVEAVDREEIEMVARGPVEVRVDRVSHPRFHDHTKEIPVHRVQAIRSVQRDQGHRIVEIGQQSADMRWGEQEEVNGNGVNGNGVNGNGGNGNGGNGNGGNGNRGGNGYNFG